MNNQSKSNCGQLTWKAKGPHVLNRMEAGPDSEFWNFAESWVGRFRSTHETNVAEKFIYLWVTVNAWASVVVPDRTKNHEDAYLIHSMAVDSAFNSRFNTLITTDSAFRELVDELASLAPVFQVLWLRNKGIAPWNNRTEIRRDFIERVKREDPYHRIRDRQGQETAFPAFAPACAYDHLSKGQNIPSDWPHILSTIYQIRCNLFHGGKTYDSKRDRKFITLAYSILWKIWESELPRKVLQNQSEIEWRRALVRSGFVFKENGRDFDLSEENEHNRQFLLSILAEIGQQEYFKDCVFSPQSRFVEEHVWLNTIENLHSGSEGGPSDMQNIQLGIMDTFMAGVVRWINAIGIETTFSCDGHDREEPKLRLADNNQEPLLDYCLRTISSGRWRFRGFRIAERRNSPARNLAAPSAYDRSWLLNVAERLYENQAALIELVEVAQRVSALSHQRQFNHREHR